MVLFPRRNEGDGVSGSGTLVRRRAGGVVRVGGSLVAPHNNNTRP
jgi:hypothetical protein